MKATVHLDTNVLVFGLAPGHALRDRIARWRRGSAWPRHRVGLADHLQ